MQFGSFVESSEDMANGESPLMVNHKPKVSGIGKQLTLALSVLALSRLLLALNHRFPNH